MHCELLINKNLCRILYYLRIEISSKKVHNYTDYLCINIIHIKQQFSGEFMPVFKCKMCGGALEIQENATVATCQYCGAQQTLPKIDSERILSLFSRANNLRLKGEFDKAAGIFESIISEFPDEAESYWGLVLCKYGIEYVEAGNGKRVPTCHRTLPVSIMNDDDFKEACEYADISAKTVYQNEAKAIDKIQKKILKIAHKESPYDIFICCKEIDDLTGSRTEDSLLAHDIYTKLIKFHPFAFHSL